MEWHGFHKMLTCVFLAMCNRLHSMIGCKLLYCGANSDSSRSSLETKEDTCVCVCTLIGLICYANL